MKTDLDKNKIVLGLSGGVDSTTAALVLKEKGFEVIGFYFDALGGNVEGRKAAEKVAGQLDIKFIYKDVSKQFNDTVISYFCDEYKKGRTPNPCVKCNPNLKFKELLQVADEEGAYYIATGHYAGIHFDQQSGLYHIKMGKNRAKDQSYMLYGLKQDALSRLIFPLYDIEDKEETRNLAKEFKLDNYNQKDSQEICFVDPESNYVEYLKEKGITSKPGKFVDMNGKVLGEHKGIINYTIGQRKGLGIALGKPAFVTKIDVENNTVVLGDNDDLLNNCVEFDDLYFVDDSKGEYDNLYAKIRYTTLPSKVRELIVDENVSKAIFEEPKRAATPGQSIVFYDDDIVIGGGTIK